MKLKFPLLVLLLLFCRGCDFYSTSLWFFQENGMQGEMNPLTRYLGVGWYGLIFTNALIVGLIIWAYAFYSFKYRPRKMAETPENVWQYISLLYFGKRGQLYKMLYKMPVNQPAMISHFGFATFWTVVVGSLLATVHNLCQFYQVPAYDTFRELVIRPLYVIYGLIGASLCLTTYLAWQEEFNGLYPRNSRGAEGVL